MRSCKRSLATALLALAAGGAQAQAFPAKPITIVVPFAPGGSIDITMRILGPAMTDRLGQPVVVLNRPGGAATIGMAQVAKSAPDGYTLGAASLAFAANPPFMVGKMPFDTEKDLVPVTQVAESSLFILINPEVPARTLRDFIALVKSKPGFYNYGSVGVASSGHLATALLEQMTGVRMVHVPYTSGPLPALMANQIQLQLGPIPSSLPFVKSGKLVALAVTSRQPDPLAPGYAPAWETVPGFEVFEWPGLVAPAGTPVAIVNRIQQEVARTVSDAEIKKKIADVGSSAVGSMPEEFGKLIRSELAKWAKVASGMASTGTSDAPTK